jgi:ATP-dependent exoDNAse (exonuclease V) alpha subunit
MRIALSVGCFSFAYLKVTSSAELVQLGTDDLGRQRFTTRKMFDSERRLFAHADTLARCNDHTVNAGRRTRILTKHTLNCEQQRAAIDITGQGDLKSLAGVAGSGKSTTLTAMREIWEDEGYTLKGAALAGITAQNLETAAGIRSRTLASYELACPAAATP